MKNLLFIISIIFTFFNCKAQSPVLPLDDLDWKNTDNAYYKDTNNELNTFEGTWLYNDGDTSLKIILVKSVQYFNGDYYEDTIVGGYQYIEAGIEKINTLTDSNNPTLGYEASIYGNTIFDDCRYLSVNDCIEGEKSLGLAIDDTNSEFHYGDLIIYKREVNGQEAIKINIEMTYTFGLETIDGDVPDPSIPWQMHNIVLIKQ